MKVVIVGSGGVGESTAALFKRRDPKGELIEKVVMADHDAAKAQEVSARLGAGESFVLTRGSETVIDDFQQWRSR